MNITITVVAIVIVLVADVISQGTSIIFAGVPMVVTNLLLCIYMLFVTQMVLNWVMKRMVVMGMMVWQMLRMMMRVMVLSRMMYMRAVVSIY